MNCKSSLTDENTVKEPVLWTEEAIGERVISLKNDQNLAGLSEFIEARLNDDQLQSKSSRVKLLNELGVAQIQQDNFEEGRSCFQNALQLDPGHTAAQYNLATFAMQEGDSEIALEMYNSILKEQPDHFGALCNAGLCYGYIEDKDSARTMLTRAADLRPEDGEVLYLAGESLLQVGEAAEALPYFRSAYKYNQGHFETSQGLAIALLESGDYDEAISICDQALMKFGAAILPLQIKGDAYLAKKIVEKAIQCHFDLCTIDLDVRDFVVGRINKLKTDDPDLYIEYRDLVQKDYPEYASIMSASLKEE